MYGISLYFPKSLIVYMTLRFNQNGSAATSVRKYHVLTYNRSVIHLLYALPDKVKLLLFVIQ